MDLKLSTDPQGTRSHDPGSTNLWIGGWIALDM